MSCGKNQLERQLHAITSLQSEMTDAVDLIELGAAEGDNEIVAEAEATLSSLVTIAEKRQLESLLSGEADGNDCFVEIHAGAGAPRRRIGRRCCCECTAVGATRAVSRSR